MNVVHANAGSELVSIIIAAYNCEAFIGAALETCLRQTHPKVEVVVVNDGSKDGTGEILKRYGGRIRVIEQKNGGLANARNTGVREARGEYIAWMDADDLVHPEKVATQVAAFRARPDLVLVSSDFSAFRSEEEGDYEASHIRSYYDAYRRLGGHESIYPMRTPVDYTAAAPAVLSGDVADQLLYGNFVHPPTVMTTRAAMIKAGAFDESLRYSSDYDLILRLARLGPFGFIDTPLLRYRRTPQQMSGSTSYGHMQLETLRILDKVAAAHAAANPGLDRLIKRRKSESLVSAASTLGAKERRKAISLLVDGWRFGLPIKQSAVALARIALPTPVQKFMRTIVRGHSV
ncbi:MAG TPA: glycosyltransferase [Steroidobacteraceae bacterium]|nr:glycosyltransferase [Steroidobacteraceae bacterium]